MARGRDIRKRRWKGGWAWTIDFAHGNAPGGRFRKTADEPQDHRAALQEAHAHRKRLDALPPESRESFAAFARRFQELRPGEVRASTIQLDANQLGIHLIPALGDLHLSEITTEVIDELRTKLLTTPRQRRLVPKKSGAPAKPVPAKPLAPKTVKNILGTLSRILHRAEEYGLIVKVPTFRPIEEADRNPDDDGSDFLFLDFDEADLFINTASSRVLKNAWGGSTTRTWA